MRRSIMRALEGVGIALGAPLGWLLIQWLRGHPPAQELASDPGLYVYMLVGTILVFGAFGFLLGEREGRLLASNKRLEELAITDALTGLRNARYFHARLAEEYAEQLRTGKPLAIAIIDLDHFKRVNDEYGHLVGDDVLVTAATAMTAVTRHGETAARVGGEEFALLMPGNNSAAALDAAERVRRAIGAAETPLANGNGACVRVTASAGVASTADLPDLGIDALFKAADDALYQAKDEGRDRSVVARAPS